eukprot:CAMPEP_0115015420 /NCGR_PEP_ID=MMETSP0216-20121206/26762_1 /TAXON_ID=223996 /ORGANISM="Protocruzia adherens, Strain Boccale" /LENGTH=502 /DNA_ID=CAMNT_0002385545 /DNA_START=71 /DNA_END=1579 /DNA_ORIENTATION=-
MGRSKKSKKFKEDLIHNHDGEGQEGLRNRFPSAPKLDRNKSAEMLGEKSEWEDMDDVEIIRHLGLKRPSIYPHKPKKRKDLLEELLKEDNDERGKFEGAIHLAFLLLIMASIKLTIANYLKYGFLFGETLSEIGCIAREHLLIFVFTLGKFFSSSIHVTQQKLFAQGYFGKWSHGILYTLFQIAQLMIPIYLLPEITPMSRFTFISVEVVFFMKIHSFFITNNFLQRRWEHLSKKASFKKRYSKHHKAKLYDHVDARDMYPTNLRYRNFWYFLVAPTLVYETDYPRTSKINWLYVMKEFAAYAFCIVVLVHNWTQFLIPALKREGSPLFVDITSLMLPSFISWLIMFYSSFHCFLNMLAEVTRFGDRMFYMDWWNSTSIAEFWRKWNIPVHEWCLRHVYVESIHYFQFTKGLAIFFVFLVSAILHEVVFSFSVNLLRPYFFVGMLLQFIPIMVLDKMLKDSPRFGNLNMWLSLMIGQPVVEILYFRDYYATFDGWNFCQGWW